MAATCPIHFDVASLRREIQAMYTRVAEAPDGPFHFHRGPQYAAAYLGYSSAELSALPLRATERFAGVGNPLSIGAVRSGEVVLDHACGAGMDLLLAAKRVGGSGRAIGVDMTEAMRDCATLAAEEAGLQRRVEIRAGMFEELPVESASVDLVISNGVLNLAPDKHRVFQEIGRVLRPGGRLYLADVVVQRELSEQARSNPELWAACIGGALPEPELSVFAKSAGLQNTKVHCRFMSFQDTSAAARVSADLHLSAVNFSANKPQ